MVNEGLLHIKDVDLLLPIYSLPHEWEWDHEIDGLTTPTFYTSPKGLMCLPIGRTPVALVAAEPRYAPLPKSWHFPNVDMSLLSNPTYGHVLLREGQVGAATMWDAMHSEASKALGWHVVFNHKDVYDPAAWGRDRESVRGIIPGIATPPADSRGLPMDLPALVEYGNAVVDYLRRALGKHLLLVDCGYIRANTNKRQIWHRDQSRHLEGTVYSCFSPIGADITDAQSASGYIPGSSQGLPQPWREERIKLLRGDVFVFDSREVHCGGTKCDAAMAEVGSAPRCVAFLGIADAIISYDIPQPVSIPASLVEFPHTMSVCQGGGDSTPCRAKTLVAVCVQCNKAPLCKTHKSDLCSACTSDILTPNVDENPPLAQRDTSGLTCSPSDLGHATTVLVPQEGTTLYVILQEAPRGEEGWNGRLAAEEAVPASRCPLRFNVHEGLPPNGLMPTPSTDYTTVIVKPPHFLVIGSHAVFGAVATNIEGKASVWRWDIIDPESTKMMDEKYPPTAAYLYSLYLSSVPDNLFPIPSS